jgi:hypothetical protein
MAMRQEFVEFQVRGGRVVVAVVVQRAAKTGPWLVATEDGKTYRVPRRLLTPSTKSFAAKRAEEVADGSLALMERREESKEARRPLRAAAVARAASRLAHRFDGLRKGEMVKYIAQHGHPTVMIVDLHPEEGKVTITNPKVDLMLWAASAGLGTAERKTRSTVKVWINRIERI